MTTVLLIIHVFVTLALIGVVLIQRSEGGGLGIGTTQGMGSFMTGRGTANLLTRTTAILATIFMALSLALALLNRGTSGVGGSILDVPPPAAHTAPVSLPPPSPNAPRVPGAVIPNAPRAAAPSVPGATSPSAPAAASPSAPAASPAPANRSAATAAPSQPTKGPTVPTN